MGEEYDSQSDGYRQRARALFAVEPQETDDPVDWWIAHQGSFPVLSRLVLDIFAIPAMATDCERCFSLARLSLTSQRLSMSAVEVTRRTRQVLARQSSDE